MGHAPDTWYFGDIESGFKNAALILDETFITPDVSHQCLEPRTAMAYWQNGKLFLHSGTQSTFQTKPAIAKWMNIDQDKSCSSVNTPAVDLAANHRRPHHDHSRAAVKKTWRPVMMRISREEEHCIGRARPALKAA